VIDERARGIKRRLISDASFTRSPSHDDAAAVGVRLAATYWPAMLVCEREAPPPGIVAAMEDLVARHSPDSLLVPLDDRALVLLFAGVEGEIATLEDIQQAVERTLRALRRGRGGLAARGIVSDAAVPLADVPHAVRALDRLRRFPRRDRDEAAVLNPRHFALHRLLIEGLSRPAAVEFVRTYVGALAAFDRAHDSHLCETLEVALDYPNRDEAARASYMHRNTFRRHLNQATEIVGIDLHDPEERLALHMALKLRALLQVTQPGDNGAHA